MSSNFISEETKGQFVFLQVFSYRVVLVMFGLAIGIYFMLRRDPRLKYHLKKFGGPPSYPVFGSMLSFIRPHHELFPMIDKWTKAYGSIMSMWIGNFQPYVLLSEPDAIQKVLSSTVHIEKGKFEYGLLYNWLGCGLLTASKQKWTQTRKLITPAFHSKILTDFLPVFNKQASILLKCFERDGLDSGKTFDMFPYLTRLTTDIICETAMGKKMNSQTSSSSNKYCIAVTKYGTLLFNKCVKPWLRIPCLYYFTSTYKAEEEYLKTLKEIPAQIMYSKKLERQERKSTYQNNGNTITKRKAFLDLLLETSENNPETFPEKFIQDEVDTFMFAVHEFSNYKYSNLKNTDEGSASSLNGKPAGNGYHKKDQNGHDTTSIFFTWAIHLLANHPQYQQKLQQELDTIFIEDPTRDVTVKDISEMKYLDCCVKETLRLYPSVPFIMRQIESDIELKDGKIIPKGATALVSIYYTHRNPDNFEDPNTFKPERFSLENTVKRHPYSYIPFSAGPRNCIGQKYALMEVKVVLVKLLLNYWIEPVDKLETLIKYPHVVLRFDDGVRVKLHKRNI